MSLSHRCGWILAHSSLQNCFNSATLEGFRAWMDWLRSCHSISIGFKPGLWLGHSKTFNFVFLEPFRGGLAGVFGIIVLLHNTSALELEVTNWWPDILLQDFLIECRIHGSINYGKSSRSWSCKAAPDHHTTTTMFDCWYDVLFMKCCVGFTPDVTGHIPSKKLNFCLISPQNICLKVLGIIDIFFGKCETSLCVLFGQQWLLPWMPFLPSLFLIVESWTLTLIEASEACSSLDVVLGSFMASWMSRGCALWVILVGQPLLGRFTTVPSFLHLWIMALTVVHWSPKALEMA